MYYPSCQSIVKLRRKKNFIIPLKKEIDFWASPQAVYKNEPFLLESCRSNQKTGRFSFIGVNPFLTFKAKGHNVRIEENGRVFRKKAEPIEELRVLFSKYKSLRLPGISAFTGGAVGYFSYECRHLFENLPKKAYDVIFIDDASAVVSYGPWGELAVVDLKQNIVNKPFKVGESAEAMCKTSDGKILVIDSEKNKVILTDLKTQKIIKTYPVKGKPAQMRWLVPDLKIEIADAEGKTISAFKLTQQTDKKGK